MKLTGSLATLLVPTFSYSDKVKGRWAFRGNFLSQSENQAHPFCSMKLPFPERRVLVPVGDAGGWR
jgi:hypothetical protein